MVFMLQLFVAPLRRCRALLQRYRALLLRQHKYDGTHVATIYGSFAGMENFVGKYTHAYIHIYTYTFIHIYTHEELAYTHTHIHTHVKHTDIHTGLCGRKRIYTHTYIHSHAHTHTHTCIHMYNKYTRTYIYTHIHIYIRTCSLWGKRRGKKRRTHIYIKTYI